MASHLPSSSHVVKTNEKYLSKIRLNLRSFHQNLDTGNFSAIAPLIAPDYFWNYDGNIILTRASGAMVLESFVTGTLNGLHAQDIYNIVDGNKAAVLFRISGKQSGPFVGLPRQEDGHFNAVSAEVFVFNDAAEAREVLTVTPIGILKEQMQRSIETPFVAKETFKQSTEKDPEYESLLRQRLASIHLQANEGNLTGIADLAVEDVEVDENGIISHGKQAFVELVTAQHAGQGSFPDKLFHDFDVLVDGTFGAVNFAWQAPQTKNYLDIEVKNGAMVRMRSVFFFEFDKNRVIVKARSVYDERVISTSLTSTGGYLFP